MNKSMLLCIRDIALLFLGLFFFLGACFIDDIGGKVFFGVLTLLCLFFCKNIFFTGFLSKIATLKEEIENLKFEKRQVEEKIYNVKYEINKYSQIKNNLNFDIKSLEQKKSELLFEVNSIIKQQEAFEKEQDIRYVDTLEGLEFEKYTVELLKKLGYQNVIQTPASGDNGIDVIAEKDNIKYAFQCKNYASSLGNKCVQETYSGKQYYNCHVGIVITNNYFTDHAKDLADKIGILLWDRDELIKLIEKSKNTHYNKQQINNIPINKTFNNLELQTEEEYDDPLYNEIVEYAIQTGKVSTSLLQRRFRLGYNRAARVIDLLEDQGIIGPANGSKPREVIIDYNKQ